MNWWSTIGLILDAIGVCIIFFNALPIEKTQHLLLESAPDPLPEEEIDRRNRRIKINARIGLTFLMLGFILQLIGSNITSIEQHL